MPAPDVVILSARRTPIGRYGGTLRKVHPAELGALSARDAIADARLEAALIDNVWIGHGRQAGSGPNPGRQVAHRTGIPPETPAQTINKACASGMQAVASAALAIMTGEAEIALAGGVESMSRMPYYLDSEDGRWGHRMGDFTLSSQAGAYCVIVNNPRGAKSEFPQAAHTVR